MKVSLNWLKDYVTINEKVSELAETLTMAGIEVNSYTSFEEKYSNFVTAEVLNVEQHPNADKLKLCKVNDGDSIYDIICGAPNVAGGQKIVLSRIGAIIPANGMKVQQVKIRGIKSSGMICSEYELELSNNHDEILVLDPDARIGERFSSYFWNDDVVLDLEITPNRPDCLSHFGIAREISALYKRKLRNPMVRYRENGPPAGKSLKITVEDNVDCPRYVGKLVRNFQNNRSPKWMQMKLSAVGIRPINAIVDVTNFVMMETGQPLHAFDFDNIKNGRVEVRRAKKGEKFVTLDGKNRILKDDNLLICDDERPVAIAGVMGGLNSEISDTTKSVLIESAYFNPSSIRNTSKYLGIVSESSYRFERGVDPLNILIAARRAAQLIMETTGGEVFKGEVDVEAKKYKTFSINLRRDNVKRTLGISIPGNRIESILTRLSFKVRKGKISGVYRCTPPSFRPDIEREIDIVEEIARIYGYNNIPDGKSSSISFDTREKNDDLYKELRDWFVGSGYIEIICNSMVTEKWSNILEYTPVEVLNPQNREMSHLRISMIPGMLNAVKHNVNRGIENLRVFEIGRIFARSEFPGSQSFIDGYYEGEKIAFLLSGEKNPHDWSLTGRMVDYFDLKGEVEAFVGRFNLDKIEYNNYTDSDTLIEYGMSIESKGVQLGYFGKINKRVLSLFDLEDKEIFGAEIDITLLDSGKRRFKKYRDVPVYPTVRRDLAFILDEVVSYSDLENIIRENGKPLLNSLRIFDLYRGDKVGNGKKSIAVSLELLSREKTLTNEEIDSTVGNIIGKVETKLNGKLRS